MEARGGMGLVIAIDNDGGTDTGTTAEIEPEDFSKPKMLLYTSYTVQKGDTVGEIAQRFALEQGTLISVNNITNARALQIGQVLKIPNQDGVLVKVERTATGKRLPTLNEFIQTLSKNKKYQGIPSSEEELYVFASSIQSANELFMDIHEKFGTETRNIFIPNIKMSNLDLQEINGDIFLWPARGYITDSYGYRSNPFGGVSREFHNGLDISARTGTPVGAAMAGRVTFAGWSDSYGYHVVISHSGGYRTLYAHLSAIIAKAGVYVNAGELIGRVGSTGRSTGPHLHFTVYKNGVTVNPRLLLR
ncbi:MAG: M23 family metallopeptidase [Treponema sp.]|jgi:murein DD-endopeptidase MepM/ murein hydrolase activator NlpD|nr:M23 family metallopeptidase [Treponema sp.]